MRSDGCGTHHDEMCLESREAVDEETNCHEQSAREPGDETISLKVQVSFGSRNGQSLYKLYRDSAL